MPTFQLNAPVIIRATFTFTLMTTGAFNVGKLFSELKLVTDNFSIYAASTKKPLKAWYSYLSVQ